MTRPLVLLDTAPRTIEQLFSPQRWAEFTTAFRVEPMGRLDELLPEAFAIVGQPDLPRDRLDRAGVLRAIMNVEGNFFPNVDYETCFARGVHVLGCGPVYARPVAEYALGLALDLARGISREDRAFRGRTEQYVERSTADSILLHGASIGLIGFGNLGRALLPLLEAFRPTVRVHDPWLPAAALREYGVLPSTLDELLAGSDVVFVLATVTADSEHLLGRRELETVLRAGARLVLVSRAAVVDMNALLDVVAAGRVLAAVDVWPQEPLPADHRARDLPGLVLSAHRAGGIPSAFREIGELVVDDLQQIRRGLPPVRMQAAARELVGRYRNRPVG